MQEPGASIFMACVNVEKGRTSVQWERPTQLGLTNPSPQ